MGAQNLAYTVEGFIDAGAADNPCGAEQPVLTPFAVTFDSAVTTKSVVPADCNGNVCPVLPLV